MMKGHNPRASQRRELVSLGFQRFWPGLAALLVGVMSRNAHVLALLVATSGLAAGCIPVVRTSVVRYGVEAKLVDANTAEPIAKRRVQVTVDGQERIKKADRSGALEIDHTKLTCRFQGRDFRLTDVSGEVVTKLLA